MELERHIGTKTEANAEATRIRAAMQAGTFHRSNRGAGIQSSGQPAGTLDAFASIYIERASKGAGKQTWANDVGMFARLREWKSLDGRRLGDRPLIAITEDAIEAFFASLGTFAASTRNHYIQLLTAAFRWAARKGYVAQSPISNASTLKRRKVAQRRRRLSADEESALLHAAHGVDSRVGFRLSGLIVAAIETGCRRGELLALRWGDVDLVKHTVLVRAVEQGAAKTGRSRLLPMSARLAAVLEVANFDLASHPDAATAYVFGQRGARVRSFQKAWETAVIKSHGHQPVWERTSLSRASRAALRSINLHFHDLRHEAGCRWLEAGWPIHHVQEMLGHSNLSQTSTYLHAAEMGLQQSMQRFDAARRQRGTDVVADRRGKIVPSEGQQQHFAN